MEPSDSPTHKGWHSRGYLPHFDNPGQIQALTFRLADSVPKHLVDSWREELVRTSNSNSPAKLEAELRLRIARYEDAGYGSCLLRHAQHAAVVEDCLLHGDGQNYRLMEWCIMPNHVHVMMEAFAGTPLGTIVRRWKTFTSKTINGALGKRGGLWGLDYHDRYIRDMEHYQSARAYIRENPVKVGLCTQPADWRWSSAYEGR